MLRVNAQKPLFLVVAASILCLGGTGCSDAEDESLCTAPKEGQNEVDGPVQCCSKGCGNSGDGWLPRVCHDGEWICEGSAAVTSDACASEINACTPLDGCHTVGMNEEEPDPAPELCCYPSCETGCVKHRVCKDGTLWECPGGSIPISRCEDYASACGGVLQRYRDNNHLVPEELLCDG